MARKVWYDFRIPLGWARCSWFPVEAEKRCSSRDLSLLRILSRMPWQKGKTMRREEECGTSGEPMGRHSGSLVTEWPSAAAAVQRDSRPKPNDPAVHLNRGAYPRESLAPVS